MEHSGLNTFDWAVIGLFLASGITAFRRGLVREVFALGTWTGAAIIAAKYYPALKPWVIENHVKNELAAGAVAALGLFAASLLVLIPTGNFLAGLIKGPTITAIDRSLGFVFGLLRGLLVLSLVYLCLTFVWPKADEQPPWLKEARTTPLLAAGADTLKELVPKEEREEAAEELEKSREEALQRIEDNKRLDELSTPVPVYDTDKSTDSSAETEPSPVSSIFDKNAKP